MEVVCVRREGQPLTLPQSLSITQPTRLSFIEDRATVGSTRRLPQLIRLNRLLYISFFNYSFFNLPASKTLDVTLVFRKCVSVVDL